MDVIAVIAVIGRPADGTVVDGSRGYGDTYSYDLVVRLVNRSQRGLLRELRLYGPR